MLYIITVAFCFARLNVVDGKCYICYKNFLLNHLRTIIIRIEQLLLHSTIYTTTVCQSHRPNYLQSVTARCMQSFFLNIYSISTVNKEEIRLTERVYSVAIPGLSSYYPTGSLLMPSPQPYVGGITTCPISRT